MILLLCIDLSIVMVESKVILQSRTFKLVLIEVSL